MASTNQKNHSSDSGYKQTELGVIPEDWDVASMAELFTFQNGVNADKAAYGKGVPFINVLEVITHSVLTEVKIPGKVLLPPQISSAFRVFTGDILFNRTSETQEEVGLASVYTDNKEVLFGGFVIRARPRDGRLQPIFSSYALRAPSIRQQIISRGQGAVRANIGQQELSKVQVFIPSLCEQEAIAEALSDTDALIESLEQLIAKKRHLKQGAMQELLTGKRRLPGFIKGTIGYKQTEVGVIPEDWRIETVEQVSSVGRGRVISHKEIAASITPLYPVYSSQTSNNGVMGYLDTYDFEGEYITWTTDGANAGTVFHREGRFNCTNVCGAIRLKSDNAKFVAKVLSEIAPRHVSRNLGNPKLMNDVVKRIKFPLPATTAEQEAIAAILSDMDAEIDALEAKLAKARQLKQGMMHNLLTGKIRLL